MRGFGFPIRHPAFSEFYESAFIVLRVRVQRRLLYLKDDQTA